MKKVKLFANFLSAAEKVLGSIAVLFTTEKVQPIPVRVLRRRPRR
jgi:hypothetical protein